MNKIWLIKSEPFKYAWKQMLSDKTTFWDGVRNYQARNNLKAMGLGDFALFYHSNEGKEIVGLVRVVKEAFQDPTADDPRWVGVEVEAVASLPKPVTLAQIKQDALLTQMALVKQGRLSVCPVTELEFARICALGELDFPQGGHLLASVS